MDDLAPLSSMLDNLVAGLTGPALERVMTDVGVAAKDELKLAAIGAVGSDLKFSGWKPRLSSGFEHTGHGQITVTPRPAGPWKVAERGRRPGRVPKGRRGGGRVTVSTPWGPRTYLAAAPMSTGSTRGHNALTIARQEIARRVPDVVFRGIQRIVEEVRI